MDLQDASMRPVNGLTTDIKFIARAKTKHPNR